MRGSKGPGIPDAEGDFLVDCGGHVVTYWRFLPFMLFENFEMNNTFFLCCIRTNEWCFFIFQIYGDKDLPQIIWQRWFLAWLDKKSNAQFGAFLSKRGVYLHCLKKLVIELANSCVHWSQILFASSNFKRDKTWLWEKNRAPCSLANTFGKRPKSAA